VTRLPVLSDTEVIRILLRLGFQYAPKRGKGSHIALCKVGKSGHRLLVIVPKRKEIPRGTLMAILEQAQVSREEFLRLLGRE